MVQIKAFRGLHPKAGYCERVAELPYDVMSTQEAYEIAKDNPYSFLHVDKSEIDLPPSTGLYDDAVYDKAVENLKGLVSEVYQREKDPVYYIYAQTRKGRTQTGLVIAASADDYVNGKIKQHEHTLPRKEVDRTRHVDMTNMNTGPIFLTYRRTGISLRILDWSENHPPLFDFVREGGVRHRGWVIDDPDFNAEITAAFKKIPAMYIADGHHRCASAVNVCQKRRKAQGIYDGTEAFNYFLAVTFPSDELVILDYNRLVKTFAGHTPESIVEAFEKHFDLNKTGEFVEPEAAGRVSLYLKGDWYQMTLNPSGVTTAEQLDVARLQNQVLEPYFGIKDPKTSEDIDFIGGIRGEKGLEKAVDALEEGIAFRMYPTPIEDLLKVADEDDIMPPKSTWFEPKLLSGLFLHDLAAD